MNSSTMVLKTNRGLVTIGYLGRKRLIREDLEPLPEQLGPDKTAVRRCCRICDPIGRQ